MICQICKQKQANAHYVQVVGSGEVVDLYICEDCAKKLIKSKKRSLKKENSINSSKSSSNVIGDIKLLFCTSCGKTLEHFITSNYKGCPDCLKCFKLHLGTINKLFTESVNKTSISELKEAMKQAIIEERYEDAASIRDQINKRHSKQ